MRRSTTTTPRTLILGFVGSLPVWRLANAAALPTARSAVAPGAPATSELLDAYGALMNDLDMLLAARARAVSPHSPGSCRQIMRARRLSPTRCMRSKPRSPRLRRRLSK
jgi:hypothetical protein